METVELPSKRSPVCSAASCCIILSLKDFFFESQTFVVFVFDGIPVFVIKMSLRNEMDFSCLLKILKLLGILVEKE